MPAGGSTETAFFRAKAKRKKQDPVLLSAVRWVAALFGTLYLGWTVVAPSHSGALGQLIGGHVLDALGLSAYLLLGFLLYGLALYFKTEKVSGYVTWAAGAMLVLGASATLLAAAAGKGGAFGAALYAFGSKVVGAFGAWLAAVAIGALGLQVLFDISWLVVLSKVWKTLSEDYRDWLRARRELSEQIRVATAGTKPVKLAAPVAEPAPQAKAEPKPEPVALTPVPVVSRELPPEIKGDKKAKKAEAAAPLPTSSGPYKHPPIELLPAKKGDANSGRPSEAEIREAIASLETTLTSFEIQARVSGYSPGPVITRYEVAPSPGVTVASIVARSNDIALSMKAKGIRMIAPIPGKAAIGIEIPNQRGVMVGLREVLESPAVANQSSPLAFALGLSSDGTPLGADLQKLPHLLVAGATNAGKSVMVHSLILSMLYRARPDEVKFLMIDPKRIELSLYDGIPHLYDPKVPCDQVQVVTHSKEAARSLKALVTVMEKRYEKFQKYRVRDIQAYNAEALKRGEPAEFYIVVVIDELADLMVVARDVVEDSIQRLAQMARAVGIHLVLATQRPSVDVITGVIKANLPSRVALRVASKVDSKVIMDGNGAEALLGKGDMLYMAPGQDPMRVQGCFVSTEELGKVVDHLKEQGKPDYPPMETMAAVGEADLSTFGVEPLEFTQALKLVLERRRVSQDLLKSQFGSSARATNLLSLLEVKQFIFKPEGSNRWEIHFDKIEDYLRTNYPQINLAKPGI
ncbi:MAG: DNA translocase FtsK 4TM domain-containing protein [Elusimicrobia bacterium]|nr:DNA translocase FtsK 4TM domain-containing protein [Elusimicrobiota bacterium]